MSWEDTYFFTWDIHYECNYKCVYCFLRHEPQTTAIKSPYISASEWIKIWKKIYYRYGKCHISVTGGEPFDYPDFMDIVEGLIKIHTFEFSTNLSWDVNRFIKNIPPNRVIINSSFHPDHVDIKEFIKKVKFLKEKKYSVSVTIVAYPPYINKLVEYSKKFYNEGIAVIIFPYRGPYNNRNYPMGYTKEEKDMLKNLGCSIGPEVNQDLMESYERTFSQDIGENKYNKIVKCYMGMKYGKIVPDGEVYRCCSAVGKEWGRLGNIIKGSFMFYNEPRECFNYRYCVCYKAMIKDKNEEKWKKHWLIPNG